MNARMELTKWNTITNDWELLRAARLAGMAYALVVFDPKLEGPHSTKSIVLGVAFQPEMFLLDGQYNIYVFEDYKWKLFIPALHQSPIS